MMIDLRTSPSGDLVRLMLLLLSICLWPGEYLHYLSNTADFHDLGELLSILAGLLVPGGSSSYRPLLGPPM